MQLRFSEIPTTGSRYTLKGFTSSDSWEGVAVKKLLAAECLLKRRKAEDKVEMQGRVHVIVSVVCDRCLAPFEVEINTPLQMLFELAGADSWQVKELECKGPDLDTILLDEPVIDIDDAFRQHIFLALPVKNLCSEGCKGICPQCGAQRNQELCSCSGSRRESPFSVLNSIK